jgi:site-specific DNA-methyltransferase (adenine-specific)
MKEYYKDKWVTIYHGDCHEILPTLDIKVDLVLTDPPYGITACDWDITPDLGKLWVGLKRIGKDRCAYIFTSIQPFTSDLVNSNREWFKYDMVYRKRPTGSLLCNKRPMQGHETIAVFYQRLSTYNPQMIRRTVEEVKRIGKMECMVGRNLKTERNIKLLQTKKADYLFKNPNTIIENVGQQQRKSCHPTQKPVALFGYLIKTYSNGGDLVLDPFLGSGTACIAAKKLNRYSIGIEIEEKYCEIAAKRCSQEVMELAL